MAGLFNIIGLVYQFGDFVVKAIVSYTETEQGQKEWADVEAALVSVGLANAPENAPTPATAQSAFEERLTDLEGRQEQADTSSPPVTRQVNRNPPKHVEGS